MRSQGFASSAAVVLILLILCAPALSAQTPAPPPLLPEAAVRALAAEVSGTAAKRNLQDLTLFHRMRGSRGFRAAAERVRDRAKEYGLSEVEIVELPADGTIFYGTQRSRPAWDVDFAELWEQRQADGSWVDGERIASWEARPIVLAQDSASGEVAAELVDVGAGTAETDYQGRDVRGKLVLTSSQPGAAYALAVDKHGAAGLVSYAQNQVTGWWKEDETLVRWGHLNTFPAPKTFAFMVSLKQARAWQERLAAGKPVRLRASVRAGQHPGAYSIATAVIPGADRAHEVVLSCHLDHQRPGANDNASGCASILETGRTLAKLIREGKLAAPRRTIRFVWPPEIEGTISLLNARPDFAARALAVIHMDMVGGDAEITKAVFHVTRSPKSLPTFVNDVGAAFGRFVNEQSYALAATGAAPYPLVDPEGSKRALQAEMVDYTEGSDHQVWTEGSFRVPAIYLNDWPDRYIHTHADAVANIDPTKLLRAAFLGAASAYYLAGLDEPQVPALWQEVRRGSLERTAEALARAGRLRAAGEPGEAANLLRFHLAYEAGVVDSISRFAAPPAAVRNEAVAFLTGLRSLVGPVPAPESEAGETVIYRRAADPKGPMGGFGYDWFEDHSAAKSIPAPALTKRTGLWGGGGEYAYEALNLVDGRRTVGQIRDDLAAICGPLPVAEVAEYLGAMETIGVLLREGAPHAP
ncbi:MAG TPA: M28 family peptidase [Thermoanaerobaculia bacterium]|nr:M28 family peptidase [Thermoanaerobaculia bacterium]